MSKRVFIIAEAGVNHNGSLKLAKELVDAAQQAGADAIKFQTFVAERLAVPTAPKAAYQSRRTGASESQLAMLKRLEMDEAMHATLAQYCKRAGIQFMSTPFDEECADFLHQMGVSLFKVASGEITNIPLLTHIASKGKPMILSTGMSYLKEVEEAVKAVRKAGKAPLSLLHCVSSYPAPIEETNLKAMDTMRAKFKLSVGLSDHTEGIEIALAAVARGADIIEKHLTLDREMAGPDHAASLEPGMFKRMVLGIRAISAALGDGLKRPQASELDTLKVARKSIAARENISAGSKLERHNLIMKRPGTGLSPTRLKEVLGKKTKRLVLKDELITPELLA